MSTTYDQDYYTWTQEQAAFLRQGRLDLLDLENLAEEVEGLGKSERRELASRFAVIICHLLKLMVQVQRTSANEKSWRTSIAVQREDLADHLAENPGLRNPAIMNAALAKGWKHGRADAIKETGLDADLFPTDNPFSLPDLMTPDFWP